MKQTLLMLAFGFLCNVTFAQQKDNKQLTAEFDKMIAQQFKTNEPGVAVLVAQKGNIIYQKGFGMANLELDALMQADNVFKIASLTKQFTGVAILQLMEQGKLDLQDDITKFIPGYPTQGNKITIEHLLTHTSGIQDFSSMKDYPARMNLDVTPTEMIDHFKNEPLRFTPGTKWEYSNSGYFLLGYIIEKITGKSYGEYLEENIFKPVGMSSSLYYSQIKIVRNRVDGYTLGATGFENAQPVSMTQPYAAGAIQSTVGDLFKFHQALNSFKLLKKETLSKALTPYKLPDGKVTDYGYGLRVGYVYQSPSIWHAGRINGFVTKQVYLPKEDVFVVALSNCDCNSPDLLVSRLASITAGRQSAYKEVPVESSMLKEYPGVYENQSGQQRIITVSDTAIFLQAGRAPKAKLKAYEKDMFYINPVQTIKFSRNKKGQVENLTTENPQGNEVWIKTNKAIPNENGIKVNEKILETYVGEYEGSGGFSFTVTKEQGNLYLQAKEQQKLEMLAESETKFFLKVNGAEIEFINESGKVAKAMLLQGGRKMEARKVR